MHFSTIVKRIEREKIPKQTAGGYLVLRDLLFQLGRLRADGF